MDLRRIFSDPSTTGGRIGLYFIVRYATPLLVFISLATTGTDVPTTEIGAVLLIQLMVALVSHIAILRAPHIAGSAASAGMLADAGFVGLLVTMSKDFNGPLVFLFTVYALAAGILLSSRAGIRMIALSSATILIVGVFVEADPTEDRCQDVGHLPRVRPQRLASPLALGVPQQRERLEHAVNAPSVEPCTTHVARLWRLPARWRSRQTDATVEQIPADLWRQLQPLKRGRVRWFNGSARRTGFRHRRPGVGCCRYASAPTV